jgi:alkylation response protein AidB-like acyl-CoA dehydrogenase
MTTSSATAPTALKRTREIARLLAGHAADTEAAKRVHPATLAALRHAGLFALPVPRRFGGGGAGTAEVVRVLIEAGRGCPSGAWVLGTSATAASLAARSFGDDILAEIFAEPGSIFCGSGKPGGTAVPASGGFRVTGRWDCVSGAEDAAIAGLGALRPGEGGASAEPELVQLLVPVAELTIDKTWDTAGLRGTGSHTLVAADVLVPADRIGRLGFSPGFMLTGTAYVLGPVLGAALGARDETERLFTSGGNRFGSAYATIAESPGAQHLLTEATRLIDEAVDRAVTSCTAIDNGEITTPLEVARSRAAFASAAKDALAALERLVDLHGTKGMARAHPVQRFWRDASTGARHVLLNQFMIEEEYGKLLAGGNAS